MRSNEFFAFMLQRELIRLRKEAGSSWPWTGDEILQTYKFTNVKREHDKTTVKLKELYSRDSLAGLDPRMYLMQCAVYRYFGTWEFAHSLGQMRSWDPGFIRSTAYARSEAGERVFTGAYVVTNQGIKAPKIDVVTNLFLAPLYEVSQQLVDLISDSGSWRRLIEAMSRVQGFGGTGFMSKEVVLDTLFTPLWQNWSGTPVDFNTWCPAGPGARRGINRILGKPADSPLRDEQALDVMLFLFSERHDLWPSEYVELVLHDIQFQLCEFDKYERVRLGEGRPRSKYRRPQ